MKCILHLKILKIETLNKYISNIEKIYVKYCHLLLGETIERHILIRIRKLRILLKL